MIYVSDIMPSKHNSLRSIIYLVIRLQCFDPLLGHHLAYIKTESVLHFLFYVPNGIPCGLQGCIQFVRGATKKWRVECSKTQHILCSVCPKFLVGKYDVIIIHFYPKKWMCFIVRKSLSCELKIYHIVSSMKRLFFSIKGPTKYIYLGL
jgi:hypothetical protein